ncbi:DUF2190 family protein [Maridesulfovibrio sp.]|uniref:DUF2190 family protein n=1 Tax=Maridesulfovibrio sp. TaxID=2795000 RepID=UPI002A18A520|nr:DUF2190 family protein [Maridesulfovibrio sp.]
MALNHVQTGNHMEWTNNTGADVVSGSAVAVGSVVGVAFGNIPDGTTGVLATEEVWELTKVAGAILQGTTVYLDGNKEITTTATDNVKAGFAFTPAADTDETVRVKINA